MKLTRIAIKGFRCIRDVEIPFDRVTVLIGENNAGKSAVLEALQICLQRAPVRRSLPVEEYDFHMSERDADPRQSPGISIEAEFAEREPEEWPDPLVQALANIIQPDPAEGRNRIWVRFTCAYESEIGDYRADWQFLNLQREPFRPRGGEAENLRTLHRYAPVYYLSALRDAAEQFSSRSRFWAPLLRSLEIPEDQRQALRASLDELNAALLSADPRLSDVTETLEAVGQVMTETQSPKVSLRALPFQTWDLMSRSQVVIRLGEEGPELPLERHGQGTQSLSVLFLFRAFIEHILRADEDGEVIEPLLALEEPEAHLHPQAARALWDQIRTLPGQTIIATHSPFFVQHVPFGCLRLLRRTGDGTRVHWLRQSFFIQVAPGNSKLEAACASLAHMHYDGSSGRLTTTARITEDERRKLCRAAPSDANAITQLRQEAAAYVSESELVRLESAVRRIRGEILFARSWIVCEGETDLIMLQRFADMLGLPLDRHGVSLIDFQTGTGDCAGFASLARAFGLAWWVICDGDKAGDEYRKGLVNAGFAEAELQECFVQLPRDQDLERYLIANGFGRELSEIAQGLGFVAAEKAGTPAFDEELARFITERSNRKTAATRALSDRLRSQEADRVPHLLHDLIRKAVDANGA